MDTDQLIIQIGVDAAKAHSELPKVRDEIKDVGDAAKDADEKGSGLGGMMDVLGTGAKIAGAGALALGGFLVGAAKAANDEQVGMDRLYTSLQNNIPQWDGNTNAVEAYVSKTEGMAFADDKIRDSLGTLITRTHDLNAAQKLQAEAMDLARGKNIDLQTATDIIGKVYDGNTAILTRYGIQVDKGASSTEALAAIQKTYAGQAEKYAGSAAGSMDRLQTAMGDALETVGHSVLDLVSGPLQKIADWFTSPDVQAGIQTIADGVGTALTNGFNFLGDAVDALTPIVEGMWGVLQPVLEFLRDNAVMILTALSVAALGFLIPAFIAWATAAGAAAAATWAAIAPVLIAAAPFIALGAAIGILWLAIQNNFLGIGDIFNNVMGTIKAAVTPFWNEIQPKIIAAWNAISSTVVNAWNWLSSTVMSGIAILMNAWNTNWGGIQTIVQTAWNTITGVITLAWGIITGIINTALDLLSGNWGKAWTDIQNMLGDAWNTITTVILPNALSMIWTFLTDFLPKLIGQLGQWALAFGSWILDDVLPQLPGWLGSIASGLWNFISTNAPILLGKLWEWTQALANWVATDVLPKLPGWLGNIASGLWTWLTQTAKDLGSKLFNEWIPALWSWITGPGGVIEHLGAQLGAIANGIWTWITQTAGDMASKALDIGKKLFNGIVDGVSGLGKALWDFISGIAQSIWDNLVAFFTGGGNKGQTPQDPAHKATGGPVSGGTPYFVGEVGPELFVPNSSGTIIPNNALGGMGGAMSITIPIYLGDHLVDTQQLSIDLQGRAELTTPRGRL